MRIAIKYAMDDVQVAIINVIQLPPPQPLRDLGTAISQLAFVAEFSGHFTPAVAIQVFTQASSIGHRPTANHLEPLMRYPAFVALMMQYREGLRNPDTAPSPWTRREGPSAWLNHEFAGFVFKDSSLKAQRLVNLWNYM